MPDTLPPCAGSQLLVQSQHCHAYEKIQPELKAHSNYGQLMTKQIFLSHYCKLIPIHQSSITVCTQITISEHYQLLMPRKSRNIRPTMCQNKKYRYTSFKPTVYAVTCNSAFILPRFRMFNPLPTFQDQDILIATHYQLNTAYILNQV